jgi:hypothetical protein
MNNRLVTAVTTILIALSLSCTGAKPVGVGQATPAASVASLPTAHDGWHRIDAHGFFTFSVPPDVEPDEGSGIDSYIAYFIGDQIRLSFEFGKYKNWIDLRDYAGRRDVEEFAKTINGRPARVVSCYDSSLPLLANPYTVAVLFTDVGSPPYRMSMEVRGRTPDVREIALDIFETIRFSGG